MLQFKDILIKDNKSKFIIVNNKKLVKASGPINSRKIQALVGYAVAHGHLKFKSLHEKDKSSSFSLSMKDRAMLR